MAGSVGIAYSGYNNMNDHIQKINEINSSPDKPDIGDIKKAELADEVKEAVNEFDRTKPSSKYNVNSKPSGHETKISKKADEATRRSLKRENEAAITLAQNGYQIEQNPNLSYTSRKPDYLIEGNVFDCYSPAEKTSPNNIRSTINEKVMIKQQTERVVLNLDDWKGNVDDILSALEDNPIEDLKEVLVVQNGQVFGIYP